MFNIKHKVLHFVKLKKKTGLKTVTFMLSENVMDYLKLKLRSKTEK